MSTYKQANLKANISLEKDTDTVPHDGKYHLIVDGQPVESFKNLRQGQDAYSRLLQERNVPTNVEMVPVNEELKRKMLREAVQKSYDGEVAGSLKVQKRSGSRRFG